MFAVQVHEGGELRHEVVPDPGVRSGEVVVELRTAALNRRDLLVSRGTYPFPLPLIPGSDGAGVRRSHVRSQMFSPRVGRRAPLALVWPEAEVH